MDISCVYIIIISDHKNKQTLKYESTIADSEKYFYLCNRNKALGQLQKQMTYSRSDSTNTERLYIKPQTRPTWSAVLLLQAHQTYTFVGLIGTMM